MRFRARLSAVMVSAALVAAFAPASPAAALDSWELNGHRYEFVNTELTWADAISYCAQQGGHLLTINSAAEQASVKSHFASGWLAGTDEGSEGAWRWLTGEPFTYTNWYPGSPDNGGPWGQQTGNPENLLMSRGDNGQWDDQRDWYGPNRVPNVFPFTCEYEQADLQADLSLLMDASPVPATAGENLTYTLTVHNLGPSDASGVQVTDTLPATPNYPIVGGPPTVALVSSNASQGTCSDGGATVTCSLGTLHPDSSATITLVVSPALFVAGNQITNNAQVSTTSTDLDPSNDEATTQTLVSTCTASALSGSDWAEENEKGYWVEPQISDLQGDKTTGFEGNVRRFIAAMETAGITVTPKVILRTPQRAYLMHYSWLIARGEVAPGAVPDFVPGAGQAPVSICWVHRDPTGAIDLSGSRRAAQEMVQAFHFGAAMAEVPALDSRHIHGLAIDMNTTWVRSPIVIKAANGIDVTIRTGPHTGLNPGLIRIGATYGVMHFIGKGAGGAARDANHWSSDGA